MMNIKLATIFKAAQKIREASYDHKAEAEALQETQSVEVTVHTNQVGKTVVGDYIAYVDFSGFYRKSMREAAEEASKLHGEPAIAEIIYLLMVGYWNDAEIWADDQLKPFNMCFDCSTRDSCGNERQCWKEAFKP